MGFDPMAVLKAGTLNTGESADVYKVKCFGVSIDSDIRDAGKFNDTSFQLAINGSSGGIAGRTSAVINRPGKLSDNLAFVAKILL